MELERIFSRKVVGHLFAATIFSALLIHPLPCDADISSGHARLSVAGDKFDGVTQFAMAIELPAPVILLADRTELAFGALYAADGDEIFLAIGPVWRMPVFDRRLFVDVGIAPTWISGSTLNGRDLGGNLHFTSSISLGKQIGHKTFVSLRVQHMSNGGLSATNPGMDMVGLEFSMGLSN